MKSTKITASSLPTSFLLPRSASKASAAALKEAVSGLIVDIANERSKENPSSPA